MSEVSVGREIAAPAEAAYPHVSDVARMGEWSPESEGVAWACRAAGPEVGARFTARNRNGGRFWRTAATVTAADPGHRFAFHVTVGPAKVVEWACTFEPMPTGCRVTETWTDRRAGWFAPTSRLSTGVAARAAHNRAGMGQTLQRLAAAESLPA